MIDETKLITNLIDRLAIARANYLESDDDPFYCGICSALETTIDLINSQPQITPENIKKYLNSLYGIRGGFTLPAGYVDTDSVRIESKGDENEQNIL